MPDIDLDNSKYLAKYSQEIEIFPPEFLESLKSMNKMMEPIRESIRIMNEDLLFALQKPFEDLNKSLGQMLEAQMKLVSFAQIFIKPYYSSTQIIDTKPIETFIPLLPAPAKPRLGIHMTSIKTFKYKRRLLKGLSQKNAPGRLMALFMNNRDLFASDEEIISLLNLEENRNLSWVLRDLKSKFRANFLTITFERTENPKGYQISEIKLAQ